MSEGAARKPRPEHTPLGDCPACALEEAEARELVDVLNAVVESWCANHPDSNGMVPLRAAGFLHGWTTAASQAFSASAVDVAMEVTRAVLAGGRAFHATHAKAEEAERAGSEVEVGKSESSAVEDGPRKGQTVH